MMMSKERLIDANALFPYGSVPYVRDDGFLTAEKIYAIIKRAPTVDAVKVDKIKLHHILIDNEGVPEVKLQIGDRYLVLRTDPVDVVKVVHGMWNEHYNEKTDTWHYDCPFCDDGYAMKERDIIKPNYCQNCGAKMDGES